jgi:hypothetical protein
MKRQIEAALHPLIGEPLTDMWRYAGCQKFEFGLQRPAKNRSGQEITRSDLGLVVSCHWRISGPAGHVVSSADFGPKESRRDTLAGPFYQLLEDAPPVVEALEASDDGALCLRMTSGYTVEVLPTAGIEPEDEQWRFMPKDQEQVHVVLFGDGLEGVSEL